MWQKIHLKRAKVGKPTYIYVWLKGSKIVAEHPILYRSHLKKYFSAIAILRDHLLPFAMNSISKRGTVN